jgi:hypothetical protein
MIEPEDFGECWRDISSEVELRIGREPGVEYAGKNYIEIFHDGKKIGWMADGRMLLCRMAYEYEAVPGTPNTMCFTVKKKDKPK